MATGGRGGRVIKVTNLNPSGAGSFRAAVEATGKRIIVFAISGLIDAGANEIEFGDGDVTIAGQTAAGAGITLKGRLYAHNLSNIIIRHLRIRPQYVSGDGAQFDGLRISSGDGDPNTFSTNFIVDHCSIAFGLDENVDLYDARDYTVQWSTIESAHKGDHPKGNNHNYGLITGSTGARGSILNNLFAHNQNRNPAISNGPADIVGNVIYNARHGFHHNDPSFGGNFNVTGNYYKRGPSSILIPIWFDTEFNEDNAVRSYHINDWVDLNGGSSTCNDGALTYPFNQCDNNDPVEFHNAALANSLFDFSNIATWRAPTNTSSQQSYTNVLAKAGAFPRDVVTRRSITETQNRTGDWNERRPTDMMEGLTPAATQPLAVDDVDNDGMADSWEALHGLNSSIDDHNTLMPSGYTAIEDYINELAANLISGL